MDLGRYRNLFLAESREHLAAAFEVHAALESVSPSPEAWAEMLRHLHSLKGMAATMGYATMSRLAHAIEDWASEARSADGDEAVPLLSRLGHGLACLGEMVDRVERGDDDETDAARRLLGTPRAADRAPRVAERGEPRPVPRQPAAEAEARWRLELLLDDTPARSAAWTASIFSRLATIGRPVHVDPPRLDMLTGRFESRLGVVLDSSRAASVLEREVRALAGVQAVSVRAEDPAPLPTRAAESPTWIRVSGDRLDVAIGEIRQLRSEHAVLRRWVGPGTERVRHQLDRMSTRLDQAYAAMLDLQLVAFDTAAGRLHQAARDAAGKLGKRIRFEILGGAIRLERRVLDELSNPLVHLVRNAVDHGIETPGERVSAGKPETGRLRLEVRRRAGRLRLSLVDDGRGFDADGIRRQAVRSGLLSEAEAVSTGDREVLQWCTRPGFSTAERIGEVSGRGVGLDVVQNHVERLGGTFDIRSRPGRGALLRLTVPSRRASLPVLLVGCGELALALPVASVLSARRRDDGSPRCVPALDRLVGASPGTDSEMAEWELELRAPEGGRVVRVDRISGRRDLVVEPLPPPLSRRPPYSGAAVLDDGSIVLVVEPSLFGER